MRRLLTSLAFAALVAPAALAQSGKPMLPKADMLVDWERGKANALAYIDAMPETAMAFMPTPGVRTFAEQFDHLIGTHGEVAAQALRGAKESPVKRDTTMIFKNKAALRAYAVATFDYAIAALRDANDATLMKSVAMFGQPAQPAWKWMEMSREHGTWTLGQTVPYLRLNKVTPPEYKLPF